MKKYFENGTIIGWANDGEEATFNTIAEAAERADCTVEEMRTALRTNIEFYGTTYFRYGVDAEATKCYDEARAEAEAYAAEQR